MKKHLLVASALMAGFLSAHADAPAVATFDDLELPAESAWYGDLEDEDYLRGTFVSGDYEFANCCMADYDTWALFSYTNHTSKTYDGANMLVDQFNNVVGSGVNGSKNYAMAYVASYMGYTDVNFVEGVEAQVIPGMYITNSAWVEDAILNGSGYSKKFAEGDWITLNITGLKEGVPTDKTVTYYLADYRSADASEQAYLKDWTWVSLSELGEITGLRFDIDASQKGSWGPDIPTYVAVDNLGDVKPTSSGVAALQPEVNAPSEYYDINGLRLNPNNLPKGIVIMRRGNTVKKILNR